MTDQYTERRYLINFDSHRLGQVFTDVLVIGSGVAGLRAAIEAGRSSSVILITKDTVRDCNTSLAQGGLAAVSDPSDSIASHVADTMRVACGLGNQAAIEEMASQAPECLEELVTWGAKFDLEGGAVALGMEGGHSSRRVVHAQGDATGAEIGRALAKRMRECDHIRLFEGCFTIDIVTENRRAIAALTYHEKYGHQIIWAKQIVLASGGGGCLFRETTNAPTATADGHAMAYRAGARLRDMEFVQFHPTALYIAGAARALISEAVRGEGAYLVDREGRRFMPECHPDAELAPRDVVSRAIVSHIERTGATSVFLDVRHLPSGLFEQRFPTIAKLCREFDIDVTGDLIPVRPAAHYMIGGVAVDARGRSSVEGLFACGEAAASGVHGANRLASNSLLEGLVFGKRVGRLAAELAIGMTGSRGPYSMKHAIDPSLRTELDLADVRNSLRSVCWRNVGIDRTGERLEETIEIIDFWGRYIMDKVLNHRMGWETQNMLTVARCVAMSALARRESRGVHYRRDCSERNDDEFGGSIVLERTAVGTREEFSRLDS